MLEFKQNVTNLNMLLLRQRHFKRDIGLLEICVVQNVQTALFNSLEKCTKITNNKDKKKGLYCPFPIDLKIWKIRVKIFFIL